jgi:Na+-driven multidrug efflux pump
MIGMLFHPVYTVVNAASCGELGVNELAGFGLGSLTLGIMAISIGSCFSMAAATLIAQSSGAKDYRMCRVYLYRQYYLNTIIFIVVCVPLLFIRPIYTLIG